MGSKKNEAKKACGYALKGKSNNPDRVASFDVMVGGQVVGEMHVSETGRFHAVMQRHCKNNEFSVSYTLAQGMAQSPEEAIINAAKQAEYEAEQFALHASELRAIVPTVSR